MLKILSIDNISARAFRLVSPGPRGVIAYASPRMVERETAAGNCNASLLPVPCIASLAHLVEPVGDFGIACTGPVSSVLLLTRLKPEDLFLRRIPVGVTTESCTSRQLIRALFRIEFGREPLLVMPEQAPQAQLVIGDEALTRGASLGQGWQSIDLSEWWNTLTGRPFVFARWTIRRDQSPAAREHLLNWLETSATLAESPSGARLRFDPEQTPFPNIAAAEDYYAPLRHRLSPADLDATRYFLSVCKEHIDCTLTA